MYLLVHAVLVLPKILDLINNTEVMHVYWLHLYPPTDRHPTKPKNR